MQAASSIELDSADSSGNNKLHTFVLKKDFRSLVETAKNNPNLLIQKNHNGQTPLHLIQTMSQSVIANNKKNNLIKNNLLYSLIKINPESLAILDSKGNSLLDLLAISVNGEDKEFIKKLAELNPSFVENHKLGIELGTIQREFTNNFGESLGEEDQLPEEQPLLEKEKTSLQTSPIAPISQELRQRKGKEKQESSIDENQKISTEELLKACKNGKNLKVSLLVRSGANPYAIDHNGESAISYATSTGNKPLLTSLKKEYAEYITKKSKEEKEITQNTVTQKETEPKKTLTMQENLDSLLIKNCNEININLEILKNLIGRGANPKAKDENGNSATTYALKAQNGREALQILHKQKDSTTDIEYAIQTNSPKLQQYFKGEKEKKLPLPAYTAFGSIIGGALGATGCFLVASVYLGSWAFPPLGIALTIIGGCMALGFIAGAIISKKATDSTTPFLEKTEKDNNNENEKKGKTIVVSDKTPESSQSSTTLRLY